LPWFREVKNIKDKIKIEEAASKGVAGISGIGINLQKFQPVRTLVGLTSNELSPKVYSGSPRPHLILQDDGKERKGKKRPIEDLDHPKSKQKHMVKQIFIFFFLFENFIFLSQILILFFSIIKFENLLILNFYLNFFNLKISNF
jgi:hypothetical protein